MFKGLIAKLLLFFLIINTLLIASLIYQHLILVSTLTMNDTVSLIIEERPKMISLEGAFLFTGRGSDHHSIALAAKTMADEHRVDLSKIYFSTFLTVSPFLELSSSYYGASPSLIINNDTF